MVKNNDSIQNILFYSLILILLLVPAIRHDQAITTFSNTPNDHSCIIIDAGHGGIDGGAVSCTGIHESKLNLDIALKLDDMMHLLGMHTILIRDTDRSIYTDGDTIAAKKISDIKERLRIVNTTPNALLVSIHQNYFHDSRYSGMQVFYHSNDTSKKLASMIQEASKQLSPDNTRNIKRSTGVYLMEHINCTGVLVECGFLSNPVEEQLLRTDTYQQKVAAVIAVSVNQYLNT